uniref:PGM_PMM_II domain-containing protein n=1 Tax=Echinostoma caproni TaxID=27848 RepID=A0A183B9C9_9TREM
LDDLKRINESSVVQPILLNIDCANGIGSKVLGQFRHELTRLNCPVSFKLYNAQTKRRDWLNKKCGADFVKLHYKAPYLYDREPGAFPLDPGNRWATIDGDADRILYFHIPDAPESTGEAGDEPHIVLLDGDKIACLFATIIKRLLPENKQLTIGVIQTAYANAAASLYLAKKVDANGHGTVLYSPSALDCIRSLPSDHPLAVFASLTNTTIGDAVADILMIEYALAYLGWSMSDWAALYTEFASRQLKVAVERPHLIQTVDAERRVSCPIALQVS